MISVVEQVLIPGNAGQDPCAWVPNHIAGVIGTARTCMYLKTYSLGNPNPVRLARDAPTRSSPTIVYCVPCIIGPRWMKR